MPSLSDFFKSKSKLRKSESNLRDLHVQVPSEPASKTPFHPTRAQLANLRQKVHAAQAALDELAASVRALEAAADERADGSSTAAAAAARRDETSTSALSAGIHVSDLHRSAKALAGLLKRHAPVAVPAPTRAPPRGDEDLYPAPLRLPVRRCPPNSTGAPLSHHQPATAFSSTSTALRNFSEWEEIRQSAEDNKRAHHGPQDDTAVPLPPPGTPGQEASRPVSLPPKCRTHVRGTSFSTEAKTRQLRSLRGSNDSLSLGKAAAEPLDMDELMAFLREGNSIRQL